MRLRIMSDVVAGTRLVEAAPSRRHQPVQPGERQSTPTSPRSVSSRLHVVSRLIYAQRWLAVGRIIRAVLRLIGVDVPPGTLRGANIRFPHCASGVVIDDQTRIRDNVLIFQHVTIGHASIWRTMSTTFRGVTIERDAILCAGATIISDTELVVAEGSVVGANSVLNQSTGPWEIWAGVPARCIGTRPRDEF